MRRASRARGARSLNRCAFAWLAFAGVLLSLPARAQSCSTAGGYSRCFDANALRLAPGASRWLSLPGAAALPAFNVGFAYAVEARFGVLSADVPGSAADGRTLKLVEAAVEQTLLLTLGLGRGFEGSLTVPFISYQRGAGPEALDSQNGSALPHNAERDPSIGLAHAIVLAGNVGLKPRVELSLPLGSRDAYASSGGVGIYPSLPLVWSPGRFALAVELGLRLRPSAEIASVRMGSQALFALGASYVAVRRYLLLGLEAYLLPSLLDNTSQRAAALGIETRVLQSEWLASARSLLDADESFSLTLAAGTSLPLSWEHSGSTSRHFVAPASPAARLMLELRYAPLARNDD